MNLDPRRTPRPVRRNRRDLPDDERDLQSLELSVVFVLVAAWILIALARMGAFG